MRRRIYVLNYRDEGISIGGMKPVDFPESLSDRICAFEFGEYVSPFYFDLFLIDGDLAEVGDAYDMQSNSEDCAGLIDAIDEMLAGELEAAR